MDLIDFHKKLSSATVDEFESNLGESLRELVLDNIYEFSSYGCSYLNYTPNIRYSFLNKAFKELVEASHILPGVIYMSCHNHSLNGECKKICNLVNSPGFTKKMQEKLDIEYLDI